MSHVHGIVWIDHHEAHVIDVMPRSSDVTVVESETAPRKVHTKGRVIGTGKAPIDHAFFDEIVGTLAEIREILVVGPGTAKAEFMADLEQRHPDVAKRIVGVETVDHPTDRELAAFARTYFRKIDAIRGS